LTDKKIQELCGQSDNKRVQTGAFFNGLNVLSGVKTMDLIEQALLRAEKEHGRETSHVQLNLSAKTHPSIPVQAPEQRTGPRMNRMTNHPPAVFIVDDEERMCRSLQAILQNSGYQVSFATSGKIALENIRQGSIDLFLSDIHMPDLNGFELLEQIRSTLPGIPVVMMTGDATVDSAIKALKMGAYDYLKKPFEPEVLLRTIENALKQKRLIERTRILDNRLKLSERRFRFMLESTPDLVYTLDNDGRFKYVKDSVAKNFGYRSVDLVGRYYESIVSEEDIQAARWRFNERRTGARATSGLQLRLKPGPRQSDDTSNGFTHAVELYATGVYRKDEANGKAIHRIGTYGVLRNMPRSDNRYEDPSSALNLDEAISKVLRGIGQDLYDMLSSTQGITADLKQKLQPGNLHLDKIMAIETNVKKSQKQARQLLWLSNGANLENPLKETKSDIRKVTFRLKTRKASQVFLVGDFNGWDKQANLMIKDSNGSWETTLILPIGRYEFKFMVDGKWRESFEDELTAPNDYGTFNNVVTVGET
jgi:PAS domain S-box-containing protein